MFSSPPRAPLLRLGLVLLLLLGPCARPGHVVHAQQDQVRTRRHGQREGVRRCIALTDTRARASRLPSSARLPQPLSGNRLSMDPRGGSSVDALVERYNYRLLDNGTVVGDPLEIFVSAFVERLFDVNVDRYTHDTSIRLMMSWNDTTFGQLVDNATARYQSGGAECARFCAPLSMECCDEVFLPSVQLSNVDELTEGRVHTEDFVELYDAEGNRTGAVLWISDLHGVYHSDFDFGKVRRFASPLSTGDERGANTLTEWPARDSVRSSPTTGSSWRLWRRRRAAGTSSGRARRARASRSAAIRQTPKSRSATTPGALPRAPIDSQDPCSLRGRTALRGAPGPRSHCRADALALVLPPARPSSVRFHTSSLLLSLASSGWEIEDVSVDVWFAPYTNIYVRNQINDPDDPFFGPTQFLVPRDKEQLEAEYAACEQHYTDPDVCAVCSHGFTVTVTIKRYTTFFGWNTIFPTIVIVLCSLLTFLIDPKQIELRLSSIIALILALTALQFVIQEFLPDSSYRTSATAASRHPSALSGGPI